MNVLIAVISFVILSVAAAFHLYWACGGRVGVGISLPQRSDGAKAFNPGPLATVLVAVFLFGVLSVVMALTGFLDLPVARPWLRVCATLLAVLFLARGLSWYRYVGLFKSIRHTTFAKYDTWLYSPLCLLLAASLIGAALLPFPPA